MRNILVLVLALAAVSAHASERDGWVRAPSDRFEQREQQRERTVERRVRENVRYENQSNRRSGWSSRQDLRRESSPTYDRYRQQRFRY